MGGGSSNDEECFRMQAAFRHRCGTSWLDVVRAGQPHETLVLHSDHLKWPRVRRAKNPIPDYGSAPGFASFDPPCADEPKECGSAAAPYLPPKSYDTNKHCRCSGEWGPFDLDIVDHVVVPVDLDPGHWVLNFRWCDELFFCSRRALPPHLADKNVCLWCHRDCEESNQICKLY